MATRCVSDVDGCVQLNVVVRGGTYSLESSERGGTHALRLEAPDVESNGGMALMAIKRDAEDWQLQPS